MSRTLILLLFLPSVAFGVVDALKSVGDDLKRGLMYEEALRQIVMFFDPNAEPKRAAEDLRARSEEIKAKFKNSSVSVRMQSLIDSLDLTQDYVNKSIEKLDRLNEAFQILTNLSAADMQVATAVTSAQNNIVLREIAKNQQIQIMLEQKRQLKEIEDEASIIQFILDQERLRGHL